MFGVVMFEYYFLTVEQFWSACVFTIAMCIAVILFVHNDGAKILAGIVLGLTIAVAPIMNMDKMSEVLRYDYQKIEEAHSELAGLPRDVYGYYVLNYMENGWISDEENRALEDIYYKLIVEPRNDASRDILKEAMVKKISDDLKKRFLLEHN